jgi:hypothetical protein
MYLLEYKGRAIYGKVQNHLLRIEIFQENRILQDCVSGSPLAKNTTFGFVNHMWCPREPGSGQEMMVMVNRSGIGLVVSQPDFSGGRLSGQQQGRILNGYVSLKTGSGLFNAEFFHTPP